MIESENLRTASLYINNQLLSRGLLRDGQNIDFAEPDAGDGLPDTMGKIMGVVNDLILRRDVCFPLPSGPQTRLAFPSMKLADMETRQPPARRRPPRIP